MSRQAATPAATLSASIIGDRGRGDTPNSSDGVVPYWSSHLAGAQSELIVPGPHGSSALPQTISELKRILRLQLVLLAGGWAHTRRAFYEALDHAPKEAGWILLQIGHLYEIERRLRRQRAGCALRDAYRSSQSRPICARIHRVLQRWSITRRFLPQSTMGKSHPLCLGSVGVAGGLSVLKNSFRFSGWGG